MAVEALTSNASKYAYSLSFAIVNSPRQRERERFHKFPLSCFSFFPKQNFPKMAHPPKLQWL
jgi:hypothetical protein